MLPSAPFVAYPALTSAILLTMSNVFMTFAWYAPPEAPAARSLVDRRVRRAGASRSSSTCCRCRRTASATRCCSLAQLKILQEVITLSVFVPFAVLLHGAAAEARLPLGRAVPAGGGLLHLPMTAPAVATPPAFLAAVSRVRCRVSAVVSLPDRQRGHLARPHARARARSRLAGAADRRLPRRVRGAAVADRHAARPLWTAARRARPAVGRRCGRAGVFAGRRPDLPGRCARADRRGLCGVPDVAAQGVRHVVPEGSPGFAGGLDHGRGRHRRVARHCAPLEAALSIASWRTVFVVLAAAEGAPWPPSRSGCACPTCRRIRAVVGLRRAVARRPPQCSRTRASGGSIRSAPWASGRSFPSRACGPCHG